MRFIKILFLFLIFTFSNACNYGTSENFDHESSTKESFLSSSNGQTTRNISKLDNKGFDVVTGKCVIFYSMDKKDYKSFISRMGHHNKWEFDIIYNSFKRTADYAIPVLKSKEIFAKYSTMPVILFLSNTGDTIFFDKTGEDYFVGQILYDGMDSVNVIEGLMKADSLEKLFQKHFNITSNINISPVILPSDSFRYFKPDTLEVTVADSIEE